MVITFKILQVLLVEDDPGDADLIKIALADGTGPGFHVTHRTSLEQGLEHIQNGHAVDVILLDLSLPDSTGEKTVAGMREAASNLPIVILTGFDDSDFAGRMLDLGAQDYLVKGDVRGATVSRSIRYAITRMRQSIERDAMVKELRQSIEMKNRMMGILAHDLRGSFGVISGYVELLEFTGEELSERVKSSLAVITNTVTSMDALVDEVLAVAVAEVGEVKLTCQSVDLAEVVRKAIESAVVLANKKNVRLIAETKPTWAELDALKIEQVLNNLIGNAVKFSNSGGEIRLSVGSSDGRCVVRVADQGVGIPPRIRANLFQPFCKGQEGTAGERTNGLGLYICSLIVAAHRGRIELETEPGRGTTFSVTLPIDFGREC